jgi:agmatinase
MAARGIRRGCEAPAGSGFLGLPEACRKPDTSRVYVLPVPYEATVSYEKGTKDGPRAIILASHQVELYDADFDGEPALSYGIHTLPALALKGRSPEGVMEALAKASEGVLRQGKLLLSLGGEHSITPGLVRGVARAVGEPLTVVQLDAHADLRDSYTGTRYSHACAMRRVLEENPGPTIQVGIRSLCLEEVEFARSRADRVTLWTADSIHEQAPGRIGRRLARAVKGRKVYLTIDVDGLDPSVIPATGTPEPGGLQWRQAVEILKVVACSSEVVAVDCVELAPRPGLHAAEYATAKLLYKCLSWIMRRPSSTKDG